MYRIILFLILCAAIFFGLRAFISLMSQREQFTVLSSSDDVLKECSSTSNCTRVDITLTGTSKDAINQLQKTVSGMPGATIEESRSDYFHAIFKTQLLGYIDDLECHAPQVEEGSERVIVCKSASRVGKSDFGVNAKRIEQLLELAGDL